MFCLSYECFSILCDPFLLKSVSFPAITAAPSTLSNLEDELTDLHKILQK